MTAEWMYPPGVAPLCGAELEAWYEDLQDILGSDAGGAKHTRPPPCAEVSHAENNVRSTIVSAFVPSMLRTPFSFLSSVIAFYVFKTALFKFDILNECY